VKSTLQRAVLFCIFFLVCLSLGYPTLNRYDIRSAVPDSADYAAMVNSGPQAARPAYRARVLVPYLAKPFARVARGRVGTWDATSFGLLVANSLLTAGAAYLLVTIALGVTGSWQPALVAALLYLLNFAVSNLMLAGMVDSGEAFFLIAAVALMLQGQWRVLPFLAVLEARVRKPSFPSWRCSPEPGRWRSRGAARRWCGQR